MARVLLTALFLLAAASGVLAQALRLSVDRPDQAFGVGEEIVFRFESELRGELSYELGYSERAGLFETGAFRYDGGVREIRYRPTVACFLYLRVRLAGQSTDIGVAVGRDDIRALTTLPADFDDFWRGQRERLAAVPLDVRRERISETEYSTSYRFSAGGVDGRRVYGFITVPKGGGPKPAAVRLPPFGNNGPGAPAERVAEKGNLISVYLTIHNAPAGQNDPSAYRPTDLRDRDRIYYRYGVLAAIRAIDVIADMPEWDRETVVVYGASQGGGLALLTAGIDARVTHVIQAVAALSQHYGALTGQATGFPYFLEVAEDRYGPDGLPAAREAVRYYDAALAAQRFRGPSMHFVNYKDPVCPPATHYAATNETRGPKVILHSLDLYHGNPSEFENTFLEWVRVHIPGTRTPPFTFESSHLGYDVSAGDDQRVDVGQTAQLSARAGYDGGGLAAGWTVAWRKEAGPGDVTLAQPNGLTTAATFSAPGTYRLRVQVTAPHPDDARKYYLLTDDVEVIVSTSSTGSTEALASVRDVRVFPNPTRGDLRLEGRFSERDEVGIGLYDVLGRPALQLASVAAGPGAVLRRTLPTAGLPAGTYVLVLRGRGGIQRVTVVVE